MNGKGICKECIHDATCGYTRENPVLNCDEHKICEGKKEK